MRALFSLEQAFAGHCLRCGFCGGDFLIVVEGSNRFEIGGMFNSLVDRGRVDHIVEKLRALTRMIDVFLDASPWEFSLVGAPRTASGAAAPLRPRPLVRPTAATRSRRC